MKAAVRKVSTNGGIVAPFLDARIDLARLQNGCLEKLNQIPHESGASISRPGLIYDFRVNRQTVIREYIVSISVTYLLLFSDRELRIVRNNELIQVNGEDLVIETPYLEADLFELKIDSLIDLLWIAHPNYHPYQLSRITEENWDFRKLNFVSPPMIPRIGESTDITPSGTTGTITLTATNNDFFFPGHVGSFWKIGHELDSSVLQTSLDRSSGGTITTDWINVHGDWSFTTGGNWIADIDIERRFNGEIKKIRRFKARSTTENVATTGTEQPGSELRIVHFNPAGETDAEETIQAPAFNPSASITIADTRLFGLVEILSVNNQGDEATARVIRPLFSTAQTNLWEEGAWSEFRGFPSIVQEHERRLMFSASRSFPNRYWASAQGDREDYELGDEAQSPFSFDLPSRDVISWMLSERQLVISTRKEEIIITSGRDDLSLSGENARARINGSEGSSRVQAIKNSNAILYAERRGRRVRQLTDNEGSGFYANTDITAFCPHLFDDYVIQMSAAQLDQKLVFVLLSNRKLLCINHNLDQAMSSWFVIETEGDFESVATLPGDLTEDIVYVITRREINGETVRQLEHFATEQWDLIEKGNAEDMIYSDMAKVFEFEEKQSVLTGLEDWEGKELQVLGDAGVQPRKTVINGELELENPARKVIVGLPYKKAMTPMWFDDVNSPSQGRRRKINKLYTSLYQSGNVKISATDEDPFGELKENEELLSHEVTRRNFADALGEAPALENNYLEITLEARHSRKQSVRFESDSPLPMNIQSIHLLYDVNER